jgi:hypothetical protein
MCADSSFSGHDVQMKFIVCQCRCRTAHLLATVTVTVLTHDTINYRHCHENPLNCEVT